MSAGRYTAEDHARAERIAAEFETIREEERRRARMPVRMRTGVRPVTSSAQRRSGLQDA